MINEWLRAFAQVLLRPQRATYLRLARQAKNKTLPSVAWIACLSLSSDALVLLRYGPQAISLQASLLSLVVLPISLLIYTFAIDLMYRRMLHGRRAIYERMLYVTTVIFVATSFVAFLFGLIPIIGQHVGWASFVYQFILFVNSLKTIAGVRYPQAIFMVSIAMLLLGGSLLCSGYFIASLLTSLPRMF
jgi:hypothetical protein